jgi:hypothetical protein
MSLSSETIETYILPYNFFLIFQVFSDNIFYWQPEMVKIAMKQS